MGSRLRAPGSRAWSGLKPDAAWSLEPGVRSRLLTRRGHDLLGRVAHAVGGLEIQPALGQHPLAFLDVGAFHADDDGHLDVQLLDRPR